jgi:hypothetical protein
MAAERQARALEKARQRLAAAFEEGNHYEAQQLTLSLENRCGPCGPLELRWDA